MISSKDVQYVAKLARVHLKEQDILKFTKNLEDILHYVAKLEKVNTSAIEPTSHVLPLKNIFREDTVRPSLPQKEALQNTLDPYQGSFKVPKVIE